MKGPSQSWEELAELEAILHKRDFRELDTERIWELLGSTRLLEPIKKWIGSSPTIPDLIAAIVKCLKIENFEERTVVCDVSSTQAFVVIHGLVGLYQPDQTTFLTTEAADGVLEALAARMSRGEMKGRFTESSETKFSSFASTQSKAKKMLVKIGGKPSGSRFLERSTVAPNKHPAFKLLTGPGNGPHGQGIQTKSGFGLINPMSQARFEGQDQRESQSEPIKSPPSVTEFAGRRMSLVRELEIGEPETWVVVDPPLDDPPLYLCLRACRLISITQEDVNSCVKSVNEKELLEKQRVLSETFSLGAQHLPLKTVQIIFQALEVG